MPLLTKKGKVLALVVLFLVITAVIYAIPYDFDNPVFDTLVGLADAVKWLVLVEILVLKMRN